MSLDDAIPYINYSDKFEGHILPFWKRVITHFKKYVNVKYFAQFFLFETKKPGIRLSVGVSSKTKSNDLFKYVWFWRVKSVNFW